jgi:hypothetical protein
MTEWMEVRLQDSYETREGLEAQLAEATSELRAHMASWEYAFAMGGTRDHSGEHPVHWETRARTGRLEARCRDLRAKLADVES